MSTRFEYATSAILASLILFARPTIYLSVERYASKSYTPYYSYLEHVTSNLGVPYPYKVPETGRSIRSWRANAMNLNFIINGLLYLAGHIYLLDATSRQTNGKLSTARLTIAVLHCIGITLVAAVPGGPRERENGTAVLHGIGALLAIGGGDLNCLLAGLATPRDSQPIYRACCIIMGTIGLVGLPLTVIFGSRRRRGFWQRLSIYPVQCWEYTTAASLALELITSSLRIKHA